MCKGFNYAEALSSTTSDYFQSAMRFPWSWEKKNVIFLFKLFFHTYFLRDNNIFTYSLMFRREVNYVQTQMYIEFIVHNIVTMITS